MDDALLGIAKPEYFFYRAESQPHLELSVRHVPFDLDPCRCKQREGREHHEYEQDNAQHDAKYAEYHHDPASSCSDSRFSSSSRSSGKSGSSSREEMEKARKNAGVVR